MVKAIVYSSNAGHTEKYAKIISEKTGLPVYDLKEAKRNLKYEDPVLYMGWIKMGDVSGYISARAYFTIEILVCVGILENARGQKEEIIEKYNITDCDVFFIRGGFSMEKLKGANKLIMKIMLKKLENDRKNKPLSPENESQYKILSEGEELSDPEILQPVISLIEKEYVKPEIDIVKP